MCFGRFWAVLNVFWEFQGENRWVDAVDGF